MEENREFAGEHAELTERILGIFFTVANDLGYGFMESVYRRSMLFALRTAGLKAEEEVAVSVQYKGNVVGIFYADLVVEGLVILELKACDEITKQHEAQLLHYLRSTHIEIGYVLAFGQRAKFRRAMMANNRKPNL